MISALDQHVHIFKENVVVHSIDNCALCQQSCSDQRNRNITTGLFVLPLWKILMKNMEAFRSPSFNIPKSNHGLHTKLILKNSAYNGLLKLDTSLHSDTFAWLQPECLS